MNPRSSTECPRRLTCVLRSTSKCSDSPPPANDCARLPPQPRASLSNALEVRREIQHKIPAQQAIRICTGTCQTTPSQRNLASLYLLDITFGYNFGESFDSRTKEI